jgi:hypothetical protein
VYVGIIEADLLLPDDVNSLKDKRRHVRGIVAGLQHDLGLAAAEVGHQELLRRTLVGAAVVSPDMTHAQEVMAASERFVAARPELEVLAVRIRFVTPDDLP